MTGVGRTWLEVVARRAEQAPDRLAFRFLRDGERDEALLTRGQLDRRARAIGALLQSQRQEKRPVLVLCAPGLDYISAIFGCIYGGAIAVPAYPPRLNRALPRLLSVIADSRATTVLTTSAVLARVASLRERTPLLQSLRWFAVDELDDALVDRWQPPALDERAVALLQYTSGSTSDPRGVPLSHRNLFCNCEAIYSGFDHGETSSVVSWLPPYHDMGLIGGLFLPAYGGFPSTSLSPFDFLRRPARWLEAITRYRATTSAGPNFAYDLCVRKVSEAEKAGLDLSSWTVAVNGAEPVRAQTVREFSRAFASAGLAPQTLRACYGLAEATLIATRGSRVRAPTIGCFERQALEHGQALSSTAADSRELVGCGEVIAGHTLRIVDPESLTELPAGSIGEVWLSGPSVAEGYWQRPEETERCFRGFLKGTLEGSFLRTGDLGFVHAGELFPTGRRKDLLIVRGRNVYPQDLEATAARAHAAVRQASVAAFSVDLTGEELPVVVCEVDRVDKSELESVARSIRAALTEEDEVSPYAVVLIRPGSLPKTSSGKVQRALCRAAFLAGDLQALFVNRFDAAPAFSDLPAPAPEVSLILALPRPEGISQLESYLAREVARLLGTSTDGVAMDRPLVGLGFDSLLVIRLANTLDAALGVKLPAAHFHGDSSVAELAALYWQELGSQPRESLPALARVASSRTAPLSSAQQRLWLVDRLAPGQATYNVPMAVRLFGLLDVAALERALVTIVNRHEVLRTTIVVGAGQPEQDVGEPGAWRLQVVDLAELEREPQERELLLQIRREANRAFDLGSESPFRGTLFRHSAEDHVLLLTVHHIAFDGWSASVLMRELSGHYAGLGRGMPANFPELPLQYADYARWQKRCLEDGSFVAAQLGYWTTALGGAPPALELPTDRPRPAVQTFRGATHAFRIAPDAANALVSLCRQRAVTPFMAELAIFQILLHRYTGATDIVVGSPLANRGRAQFASLIGCFVNSVALRVDLSAEPSFLELLSRVRAVVLGALAHQDLPFEKLVEALRPERDASRAPIFQVVFAQQGLEAESLSLAGLRVEALPVATDTAKYDLWLGIEPTTSGLNGVFEYNADLFDETTIARMARHFVALVEAVVAAPERSIAQLPLLDAAERRLLLEEPNRTGAPFADLACIHELFERRAQSEPACSAAEFDGRSMSYGELSRRSNQLARFLRTLGVGPEVRVGLCVERSFDLLIGMLGILKAGGAYVPVDPNYPAERVAFLLEDSAIPLLLTHESIAAHLPEQGAHPIYLDQSPYEGVDPAPLPSSASPRNLAYVMYTSGSTGRPKAVQLEHRGLCNLSQAQAQAFELRAGERVFQFASASFDASVWEIFMALTAGATLDLGRSGRPPSGEELALRLRDGQVALVTLPPSVLATLPRAPLPDLRVIIVAGEACAPELARFWGEGRAFFNAYGPTETTVCASMVRCSERTLPPNIGQPIQNTRLHVLDARLEPVPVGVEGDLYVAGVSLARGYLNQPELSALSFIPNPHALGGDRLYRTGDRARYLADGSLEFRGRRDRQVKLRGFRIELDEIANALRSEPRIEDAVVVVRKLGAQDERLVAYFVLRSHADGHPRSAELRHFLQQRLPEYMIPALFVELTELRLTPSGKLDLSSLPAPELSPSEHASTLPRTATEREIVGIFEELLGLQGIGVQSSFFDLGGHSLLATQLVARLRQRFGVELPLRNVFEHSSVEALARIVEANEAAAPTLAIIPRASRQAPLPLSFAQRRLWFLDQLEPGQTTYNIPIALRLSGALDAAALLQSLGALVERHESLRTTFDVLDTEPVQHVAPSGGWSAQEIDLQARPAHERAGELQRLIHAQAQTPFDLRLGPLFRTLLVRVNAAEHVLLLSLHHIISDAWSMRIFVAELARSYAYYRDGTPEPLPEPRLQYADYALWQQEQMRGPRLATLLDFWKRQLDGAPSRLELFTDQPRPRLQGYAGASVRFRIAPELLQRIERLCQERAVTPFMALLSAFQVLLYRYTAQEDIVVGTPIANRNQLDLEGLMGLLVNTLPLRATLVGTESFAQLLSETRNRTLDAYEHQELPFERLVEDLRLERDLGRSPVFQVLFDLEDARDLALNLPGLEVSVLPSELEVAKFELTLSFRYASGELQGTFEYNRDLFDARTIERMAANLQHLLSSICDAPELGIARLELIGPAERELLLPDPQPVPGEPNASGEELAHRSFELQADARARSLAIVSAGVELGYGELERRANRLAHWLRAAGVQPETVVGVCLPRSAELVIALLAVLKASGTYLPLDPKLPAERLAFMTEAAGARLILTRTDSSLNLSQIGVRQVELGSIVSELAQHSSERLPNLARPANLAYVLYTSGSTGRPKGVAVPHSALANHLAWMQKLWSLGPADRVLQNTAPSFDVSLWEMLGSLSAGASLVIAGAELEGDVSGLSALILSQRVSAMQGAPTLYAALLDQPAFRACTQLRYVGVGGEELQSSLLARLLQQPFGEIWNFYGPTEATIDATCYRARPEHAAARVPIGRALENVRTYVLSSELELVPLGVPGELYIAGAGLARGYVGRSDLSASRFLPDPFSRESGQRMYRTGDRVRRRADGELEFLGRFDRQVKLRGLRVELAEIEAALLAVRGIREAVVSTHLLASGESRLIAYYVAAPDGQFEVTSGAPAEREIRAQLKRVLPAFMIPAAFVPLSALPTNRAGKVDRAQLPAAPPMASEPAPGEAPQSEIEARLCELMAGVLELTEVRREDNFFEIGGHSLLATQVMARVRQLFGVELPLRTLFEAQTPRLLAEHIERGLAGGHELVRRSTRDAIGRADPGQATPLSFSQQRLWLIEQLYPGLSAYNLPAAVRLSGRVDEQALERALVELLRRHSVLRSRFPSLLGEPTVIVAREPEFVLERIEAASVTGSLEQWLLDQAYEPFDLSRGPLVRAALVRLNPEQSILLLTVHHIVTDGWSMAVAMREVAALYAAFQGGRNSPLPELSIQYSDYAAWQRNWLRGEELDRQLAFWLKQLRHAPTALELPTDRPRPLVQTYAGSSLSFAIDGELTDALSRLAERAGATLYMTLLAGFQALLFRYTGQPDFVIGSPIANRTRLELEPLIGFFANTLALRADLSGAPSFVELLARVRTSTLDADAHQHLPFEKLVESLNPERQLGRTPLFQVMFVFQSVPLLKPTLAGVRFEPLPLPSKNAKFELTLLLEQRGDGMLGVLEFNTDLFERATIERLSRHYVTILRSACAAPERAISRLDLLDSNERAHMLSAWNATQRGLDVRPVDALFDEQASAAPNQIAATFEGQSLTYAELRERSEALAHELALHGAGPEHCVAVYLDRSLELLVALLAVLKVGAAYLPLDPGQPELRTDFMRSDANSSLLLTIARHAPRWRGKTQVICVDEDRTATSGAPLQRAPRHEQRAAYVLYTSGSTGKPKAVVNTHLGLTNRLAWMQDAYRLTPEDRVLHKTPLTFDVSVWELLWPLVTGARLVLARADGHRDPEYLKTLINTEQVTTLHFVPSMLALFLKQGGMKDCSSLRRVFASGEVLATALVAEFFEQSSAQLHNLYGPTEAAIDVSFWECKPDPEATSIPIGAPIHNTTLYVLDPELEPTPIGVAGDLFIGGVGLARGYLGRADLTADRFVPDPFAATAGARLYRTGDRARLRADGALEFLGRSDRQLKIRGVRIELGEVEAALRAIPEVDQAVVVVKAGASGDKRLVAYVTAVPGAELPTPLALRATLAISLTEAMVPSGWVRLSSFPVTSSGKLDLAALSATEDIATEAKPEFVAPSSPVELTIARLVEELLELQRVGAHDNFFHLGGHSLLAVRFVARLRDAFGVELPLRALFESPTVFALAAEINQRLSGARVDPNPIGRVPRDAYRRRAAPDRSSPQSGAVGEPASPERGGSELSVEGLTTEVPNGEAQELSRANGSS